MTSKHLDLTVAVVAALAIAATTAPSLLAYNAAPSPTFLNQALAFALWGAFVLAAAPLARAPGPQRWRPGLPESALLLLAAAVAWSWGPGSLPSTLALSALGTLAAALLLLQAGRAAGPGDDGREALFLAVCWGLALAGLINVLIAVVQVFAPALADGSWIAGSSRPGRAVGNLRQPNHLSSLLMWACIGVAALVGLGRLRLAVATPWLLALVFAVVLTASRTGLVSVLLLAAWGLLDRRMPRGLRVLLLSAPLAYALAWWGMAQWAASTQQAFGGAARLAETDISGTRFGIWANTLALIAQNPLAGVGWGRFNLAWSLTPFPGRPTAFFDHTHNLPLQLAVELGLPLALLVMGLLLAAFGGAWLRAARSPGDDGTVRRAALMVVLMIGLHSLLEYPLWYSYFLLPAAWMLGVALRPAAADPAAGAAPAPAGAPDAAAPPRRPRRPRRLPWVLGLGGLVLMAGAVLAAWDYRRVVAIFQATPGAPPLAQRVADGQRSVFFGHHADYAAFTSGMAVADSREAIARASHYLLDTRFTTAWARHLAAQGDIDGARHLAARLREFGRAGSFFEPCDAVPAPSGAAVAPAAPASSAAVTLPFQCAPPASAVDWRAFAGAGPR